MAMFQQYKGGGIRPVTGVIEAGANIGKMYQEGLSKLGEGIGEGIKNYQIKKQEDKMRTAEAEAEAAKTQFLYDQIKDNPELAGFAKSFEPHIANMGKFAEMDSDKKNSALLALKAFNSNIAPALGLYKEGLDFQTKQGIDDSKIDAKKFGKEPDVQNITLAIKTPFDPNKDYTIQRARAGAEVDKFLAANPDITNTDKEAYLTAWHDLWRSKINNASDAQMNPDTKAKALKSFDSYVPYSENAMTDESTGVTDYAKEAELYNAVNTSAVQAKYEALKPETAVDTSLAKPEPVMPSGKAKKEPVVPLTASQKFEQAKTEAQKSLDKDNEELQANKDELYNVVIRQGKYGEGEINNAKYKALKEKEKALTQSIKDKESAIKGLNPASFKDDEVTLEEQAATQTNEETRLKNGIFKKTLETEKDSISELLDRVKKGEHIGLGDRLSFMSPFGSGSVLQRKVQESINDEKTPTGKELAPIIQKWNDASWTGARGMKKSDDIVDAIVLPRAQALEKFLGEVRGVQDAGIIETDSGVQPANRLAVRKLLEDRLASVESELKNYKPTPEAATPKTELARAEKTVSSVSGVTKAEEKPAPVAEPVLAPDVNAEGRSTMGVKIGERLIPRELTWQDKKQEMKDWFIKTKQFVPSNFDKIFAERFPESKLATAKTNVGDVWYDGEKWHLVPAKEVKPVTYKEISEHKLYNYGAVNQQTGTVEFEERIPNSGILTKGFVGGGEKKAEAFDTLLNDTAKIREYVPKLLAMFDKTGHSIPQQNHGQAEIMMTELKAAIRVKTVGTGPVALPEHAMIAKQIGDPTAFFSWDKISKQKLETLLSTAETALKNNSAGIQVQLRPAGQKSAELTEQAQLDIKLANRRK